ncbi:MAG: hypothetical protein JWO94_529 [Verrucomicrobiaceae bacterium]|nr:hypothetical protein [Verrucomicrobiaceae bacterium]
MNTTQTTAQDRNEDPITGAPGAHPVGVGVGAAGGGTAGAAIGMAGGPVGAVVGAAVGAIVGGLAGKSVAEEIDPTAEEAYWAENFGGEGYVDPAGTYNDYAPAYRAGYLGYGSGRYTSFDHAEPDLKASWDTAKGESKLPWEKAKPASRAAWDRVEKSLVGDADAAAR